MKKKIIIISLILLVVSIIIGLYGTFASSSTISGSDNTYAITLTGNTGEVMVPAGTSKTVIYQITNTNKGVVQYAVAYSGTNITVKIYNDSQDSHTGFIDYGENKFVKLYIENSSDTDSTASIKTILGYEHGGSLDSLLPSGYSFISESYSALTLIKHITNLYVDGNPEIGTNTNVNTYYQSYQDETNTWGLMNDGQSTSGVITDTSKLINGTKGNIRYFGSNDLVNNYIYFNCSDYSNQTEDTCEKWRIIGIVDGKVKIRKYDGLGDKTWDDNYLNNWSTSTLNAYLNGDYYSGLISNNSKNADLISSSTWYLGGYNTAALYTDDIYAYERTNEVGTTIYSGNPFTVNTNIGIIYASDYGYAADLNKCTNLLSQYNSTSCNANNWLYNNVSQWLINPYSTGTNDVWFVYTAGVVNYGGSYSAGYSMNTIPTLHLNTELILKKGDGTIDNPYQIIDELIIDNNVKITVGETMLYKLNGNICLDKDCNDIMSTTENPIDIPTKEGYTFGGYYTEDNGNGTQMITDEGYATENLLNYKFSIDTILYPKWIGNTYTITYNANNLIEGLEDIDKTTSVYMNYSVSDGVVTVTANQDDGWGWINADVYLEAGKTYLFNCDTNGIWGTDVEVWVSYGDLSKYYYMSGNNNFEFTPDESNKYYIRLDVNTSGHTYTFSNISITNVIEEKEIKYGETYGEMPTPTRDGYVFVGWYDETYSDFPMKYYADTNSDLYNAFGYDADKLYNHYISNGKNEGRRISQYISTDKYETAANQTLYAYFRPNTYTINYYSNINYISEKDSVLVVLNGRTFYKNSAGGALLAYAYDNAYTGPVLVSENADAVAYRQSYDNIVENYAGSFTYNNKTYYYSNGGHWMGGNFDNTHGLTVTKYVVEREGDSSTNASRKVAEQLLKDNTYTVSQTLTYGKNEVLKKNSYTREYYSFEGWSTSPTGNAVYTDGDTVKNLATSGTVNLYAVWKENYYTIKYDANGGSGAPSSQLKSYGKTITIPSTTPTRSGYTFLGWSTSNSATSATYYAGGSYTSNADATLYAVWTTEPTISHIEYTNVSSTGYDVYVYGVTDPDGINYVQFPTWTTNNSQDDITWHAGTNQGNGTYYYRVNISDHNYEYGAYNTHVYVVDSLGNQGGGWAVSVNVPSSNDTTAPTCKLSASSSGVTFASMSDDVVSSGMSTSSTAVYNGTTSLGLSSGTKYGFVKDAAGNTGSCSLTISTTSISCSSSNYDTASSSACLSGGYLGYAGSNSCSRTLYYSGTRYKCQEYDEGDGSYTFSYIGDGSFSNYTGTCGQTVSCKSSTVGSYWYNCTSSYYSYSGTISCYS